MKIAVTTPTGHIGSAVARLLLDSEADLILLARDAEKVHELAWRGARAYQGSLEDAEYISQATRGADALLWVTPPNFTAQDFRGYQNSLAASAAKAIRQNQIARVVNISSIGAHMPNGCGPVSGLYDVEKLLEDAAPNIKHLRAGYFFENYLYQLDHIRNSSCVYLPVGGSIRLPMIATADIARAAAETLLDSSWTGRRIRGLHGPADLSFDRAAEELSRGLGRKIRHVEVGENEVRQAMRSMGASSNVVESMLEMYRAIDAGVMVPQEQRTSETTTPTTLAQFALETIAPMLREHMAASA